MPFPQVRNPYLFFSFLLDFFHCYFLSFCLVCILLHLKHPPSQGLKLQWSVPSIPSIQLFKDPLKHLPLKSVERHNTLSPKAATCLSTTLLVKQCQTYIYILKTGKRSFPLGLGPVSASESVSRFVRVMHTRLTLGNPVTCCHSSFLCAQLTHVQLLCMPPVLA